MNVPTILQRCIYTIEKEGMGHTIIMGTGLEKVKDNRTNIGLLTNRLIEEINNSLLISRKHGNTTSNVHLYLKGCSLKSFSFSIQYARKKSRTSRSCYTAHGHNLNFKFDI